MDRRLLLLGLLRRQAMHGYQINEFVEEEMDFCINLKKPTAYYILDKLAQEGCVQVEQAQEGNRPPRRVYRITEVGEALFFELLRSNLEDHHPIYYPSDIGIAFMDQLSPKEVADHLRHKRERIVGTLEALQQASGHSGTLQRVLDHDQRLLETELDWLEELIADLEGSSNDDWAAGN
jgi:DNA-binding PadR family transcriptional regulator